MLASKQKIKMERKKANSGNKEDDDAGHKL